MFKCTSRCKMVKQLNTFEYFYLKIIFLLLFPNVYLTGVENRIRGKKVEALSHGKLKFKKCKTNWKKIILQTRGRFEKN